MNRSTPFMLITLLLFGGCAGSNLEPKSKELPTQQTTSQEPAWLDDPYVEHDKVAAIGCARINFKGRVAQRKKAESIALDEIALQVKTTVSNQTLRDQQHYNGREVYSKVHSISDQSVEDLSLSTKIKDSYTKENGDICVWMVLR
jgi:hypothetical protein